jgi:hypothetical protein
MPRISLNLGQAEPPANMPSAEPVAKVNPAPEHPRAAEIPQPASPSLENVAPARPKDSQVPQDVPLPPPPKYYSGQGERKPPQLPPSARRAEAFLRGGMPKNQPQGYGEINLGNIPKGALQKSREYAGKVFSLSPDMERGLDLANKATK